MPSGQPNNPYSRATGAYDQKAQAHAAEGRELEARVLLKSVRKLQALQASWEGGVSAEELDEVLMYNRQIWLMFYDTAIEDTESERPAALRSNIASLALFVFKHTLDILANPKKEKLTSLIEINQDIAAGLMSGRKAPVAADQPGEEAVRPTAPVVGSDTFA